MLPLLVVLFITVPILELFVIIQIADEIVSLLASDPNAAIRVTLEIAAEFPSGVVHSIRRGVGENSTSLGFKTKN